MVPMTSVFWVTLLRIQGGHLRLSSYSPTFVTERLVVGPGCQGLGRTPSLCSRQSLFPDTRQDIGSPIYPNESFKTEGKRLSYYYEKKDLLLVSLLHPNPQLR